LKKPTDEQLKALEPEFTFKDSDGAFYQLIGNKVFLKPPNALTDRVIGTLVISKKNNREFLIFMKKDLEKFKHQKTNSWSVHYALVVKVDGIMVISDEGRYKILKKDALEQGQILYFSKNTEKKLYIPANKTQWSNRRGSFYFEPV